MILENVEGRTIYLNEAHVSEVFRYQVKDGRTLYEVRTLTNHIFTTADSRFDQYFPTTKES